MIFDHDFHIHTVYSNDTSKKATVEAYVTKAKELGLKKLGFAEHFWDDTVPGAFPFYVPLTFAHVSQLREDIAQFRNQGVELFFGCEVEYDPVHRAPALSEAVAEQFDFVIVPNSHSHETMPKEYYDQKHKHAEFILNAFWDILRSPVSRYVTGVAHPFSLVRSPYPCDDLIELVSDSRFADLFGCAAEKGVALEVNVGSLMGGLHQKGLTLETAEESQLIRMLRLGKQAGCKFFIGSDAHAVGHLENHQYADAFADLLGLTQEDIMPMARK
jgi:HisJ family histidinol phosphate phosphatase